MKSKMKIACRLLSKIIMLSYPQNNSQKHKLFSQKLINQYKKMQNHPKVVRKFHLSAVDPSPNRIKAVQLLFNSLQLKLHKPLILL